MLHVCLAIYRVGFIDYLEPVAKALRYNSLMEDFTSKKWSGHSDFLLIYAEAAYNWLHGILKKKINF